MHKKFEINQIKIKGGCQPGKKVVPHNSKSDFPLAFFKSTLRKLVHNFAVLSYHTRNKLAKEITW